MGSRIALVSLLSLSLAVTLGSGVAGAVPGAQDSGKSADAKLPPGQTEQLVAPIALHPDALVSQILMASTYPLEVVAAKRWLDENKGLKGDAFAKALEAEPWDPSVKSLVEFPQVLEMMDKKLDWMQRLGNAFLSQKTDVMNAIQALRKKAQESGNLESSKEQTVKSEGEAIVIEPADSEVIYVPTYNPTVVYGSWPYPAYPPYYYYPPGYSGAGYGFAVGITIGLAWGYAWGNCNWGHDDIDIDIDRNVERNRNIDRGKYQAQLDKAGARGGKGTWQHDPSHRQGVSYGDRATAERYGAGRSPSAASRESYRGRGDAAGARPAAPSGADRSASARPAATSADRRGSSGSGGGFGEVKKGSEVKRESSRGHTSRRSSASRGGSRGGARGGRR